MNERWYIQTKKADFEKIAEQFHISPILARIIRNRDIIEMQDIDAYLHPDINNLSSPWLFKDMDRAVDLIKIKIAGQNKIRIISGWIFIKRIRNIKKYWFKWDYYWKNWWNWWWFASNIEWCCKKIF